MKKIFVLVMLFAATLFCKGGAWTNYPVATNLNGSETFLFGTATNNKLIVASNLWTSLAGLEFPAGNVYIGFAAGEPMATGSTAVGWGALNGETRTIFNVANSAFGNDALADLGTHADGNTGIGSLAGYLINNGSRNTAVGYRALGCVTVWNGSDNIAIGYNAGSALNGNGVNNNCILIGNDGSASDTNIIRIGYLQSTTCLSGVITGNGTGITNIIHLTTSTATSGTVTAVTAYQSETIYLSNSSTISSITIALPTTTITGQTFRIHSKSAVTTLSITGTSFADSAVTSLTAGQTIGYQAQNASGAYIRIQ